MHQYVEAAMRQDAAERLDRMTDQRIARAGGDAFAAHATALAARAGIQAAPVAPRRSAHRVSLAEQAKRKVSSG